MIFIIKADIIFLSYPLVIVLIPAVFIGNLKVTLVMLQTINRLIPSLAVIIQVSINNILVTQRALVGNIDISALVTVFKANMRQQTLLRLVRQAVFPIITGIDVLATHINLHIASHHFFTGINLEGSSLNLQTAWMLNRRTARRRAALIKNHFIRINLSMWCREIILAILAINFFQLAGLAVKVIMCPIGRRLCLLFNKSAALQQPDITGLHIALHLRGINILTVLRHLNITLSMKITANRIINSMLARQRNRQALLLLFAVMLLTMLHRSVRFSHRNRTNHTITVAITKLLCCCWKAQAKHQGSRYKSLMHKKNSFIFD